MSILKLSKDYSYVLTPTNKQLYFSLILRTILFLVVGLLFVLVLQMQGSEHPFKDAEKWWPYQAIIANIITYLIIRRLLMLEKETFKNLFNGGKLSKRGIIKEYFLLTVLAVIGGAVPLYIFSRLLLGSFIPPTTHFQALPIEFAAIALVLFPIFNAVVELPTYLGYVLPRLQKIKGKNFSIVIVGVFLALQHIFLPILLDMNYILWRFLSFIILSVILGIVYTKTRRLTPLVIIHLLMDFQLVLQMFISSVNQ